MNVGCPLSSGYNIANVMTVRAVMVLGALYIVKASDGTVVRGCHRFPPGVGSTTTPSGPGRLAARNG